MIYLIDDKIDRQKKDYHWDSERFERFREFIKPYYRYHEIVEKNNNEKIFKDGNVILFHESFFDNPENVRQKDVVQIREELLQRAKNKQNHVVFFSGSKNNRTLSLENYAAYLPVSTLYQNLEAFVIKYSENDLNLKYLLYGSTNVDVEEELNEKIVEGNNIFDVDEIISTQKSFIAINDDRLDIPVQLQNSTTAELSIDEDYMGNIDPYLCKFVLENLNNTEYDSIFIPLCFGDTLSDFNGLKLALCIRCTNSVNRLKPIYIYSPVGHEIILDDTYFNILRTKNVELIGYSRKAFLKIISKVKAPLLRNELGLELSKLKLDPPLNYYDNHSVANEWGIYQLARNADVDLKDIEGFDSQKLSSLYFLWLIAKNSLDATISTIQKQEQRKYTEELPGIKILGKIDISKFAKK